MARIARSLDTLRSQVNAAYPSRSKSSDGWIGDAAHASRPSDHNPNANGVVQALDITHDPRGGFDSYKFAEHLRQEDRDRHRNSVVHADSLPIHLRGRGAVRGGDRLPRLPRRTHDRHRGRRGSDFRRDLGRDGLMSRRTRNLGPCSCCQEKCVGFCSKSPVPAHVYLTCIEHNDGGHGVYNILGMSFKLTNVAVSGVAVSAPACAGFAASTSHNQVYYGEGTIPGLPFDDGLGNPITIDIDWWMRAACCGNTSPPTTQCDNTPGLSIFLRWSYAQASATSLEGGAPRPGTVGGGELTNNECAYDNLPTTAFLNTRVLTSCDPLLAEFHFKRLTTAPYPSGGGFAMDLGFLMTT